MRIGTAPDSWGVWFPDDPRQIPWPRFLDEVAEAEYEWIELGPLGYLPPQAATLRAELGRRRLKVAGSFVMVDLEDPAVWPVLHEQVNRVGELLAELGASILILIDDVYTDLFTGTPRLPAALDSAAWARLIETTHKVADLASDQFGLRVALHPHAQTHVESPEQVEAFLHDTNPRKVSLCVDTGHLAYTGVDPILLIRKYPERVAHVHLKNVDRELQQRVAREGIPFAEAVKMGTFCEPAAGAIDFAELRDALHEAHFDGFAIVEQDMYPAPFDKPLPIAKRTRRFLRGLDFG